MDRVSFDQTTPRFSLPMYFPPAPFSLADTVTCATYVNTAYDQFAQWADQGYPSQEDFSWTPNGPAVHYSAPLWGICTVVGFQYPEPFGFVASDDNGNVYVALRGSMTKADFYEDAWVDQTPYTLASGFGNVHSGFFDIIGSLGNAIVGEVAVQMPTMKNLFITGHSLGSGLTTLAVPLLVNMKLSGVQIYHYNFASPRAGDPQFAYATNMLDVPAFRIVNTEDIVPDSVLPIIGSALYKHIGTQVDFTAQYGTTDGNHSMINCYTYAVNNPDQPEGPVVAPLNYAVRDEFRASPLPAGRVIRPLAS